MRSHLLVLSLVLSACWRPVVPNSDLSDAAPDGPSGERCIPNTLVSCPCPPTAGLMRCALDGTLGPCVCPVLPSETYDFVITHLTLDAVGDPPSSRGATGFNLDDRFSPAETVGPTALDCRHADYFSALDPDQNQGTCTAGVFGGGMGCRGGVDNQLPAIARTLQQHRPSLDLEAALNEPLDRGQGLMLVRVSDVDGQLGPALNDPAVTVRLYPSVIPVFADCRDIARPRQVYAVDDRSLTVPGDLASARLQFGGSIVQGRLRVTPTAESVTTPTVHLTATFADATFPLDLYQARLRFTLGEREGAAGNLGGYLSAANLLDSLVGLPELRDRRDAAQQLVETFVDVAPDGSAATCHGPDGGIGVGLGFTVLRAIIAERTVSTSPRGTCGS